MLNFTPQTSHLLHTVETGHAPVMYSRVYRLTLAAPAQAAVEEWQRALDSVYEHAGYGTALTLTDARHAVLPPLAFATLLSDLWTRHLHRRLHSRNAVLCASRLPASAASILHALPGYGNNVVRFFTPVERQDAIHWLLTDD